MSARTGLRYGELEFWGDVVLTEKFHVLVREYFKNKKDARIPLITELEQLLAISRKGKG